MRMLKQALVALGGTVIAAVIIVLATPKVAHALAALVQVANTSANPVPTVATDNPAAQPFQFSSFGNSQIFFEVPVPAGQRLVIENISVACSESPVNLSQDLRVSTVAGGNFAQYTSAAQQSGTSSELIWNRTGRLYADGGTTVSIASGFGTPPGSDCGVALSGYLVNTP